MKLPLLLSLLGTALLLSSCAGLTKDKPATAIPTVAIDPKAACLAWKAIYYSRTDTPETKEQVRENNAAHDAFCAS